jgi:acetyl-CoA acetyltransferase
MAGRTARAPRDVAIVGHALTKFTRRSGRSVYTLAAEVLERLLARTGIDKRRIDGLAVGSSYAEAGNAFYSNQMCDYLGLSVHWLQTADVGGCINLSLIERASQAIRSGRCETIVLLSADREHDQHAPPAHVDARTEWLRVQGLPGAPGQFGLLLNRYSHLYDLDAAALAKISVTQRAGAVNNEYAVESLRRPITEADYFASRTIAAPIRLLDCTMPCDGGGGLVLMSTAAAKRAGFEKLVHPVGYAELTNIHAGDPLPDTLDTGFKVVGPRALAEAGLELADVKMFFPYDDFTFAVLLQLEQIGFCPTGEGSRFVLGTDISHTGTLPINPGGGMLSMGQPHFAGGLINPVEAVTQMFGEAGARQVPNPANALLTGIGALPMLRNFGTTAALVLENGR